MSRKDKILRYTFCVLVLLFPCAYPLHAFEAIELEPSATDALLQNLENKIYSAKIIDESTAALVLEIDYFYSGSPAGRVYLGGTAYSVPTGFRFSQLISGRHKAVISIFLPSGKPGYNSETIDIFMYLGGKNNFYRRVYKYKKRWGAVITTLFKITTRQFLAG